jgi:light-regulated signal transduction histidine kinase (bacteriophytochrome)
MGRLIDGLLAMAKLGRREIHLQSVDHEALVHNCADDLRAAWPERSFDLRIAGLAPVEADPTLLGQVWVNLLSNAAKYSQDRPRSVIHVGTQVQGDDVVYFCQDNGVGFDMRYANKLFEAFQRLHSAEEFEGIGIGLATVHRIIERHHGRIWANSEVGQGATFYFTLNEGP